MVACFCYTVFVRFLINNVSVTTVGHSQDFGVIFQWDLK